MSAHAVFYKKISSKNSLFYLFCFLCIIYVAFNIIYSQKYNPGMYGVMNGEVNASTTYLKDIWGTQLFDLEVQNYQSAGRTDILETWQVVQSQNRKRINILENAVKLHPYSPELYYNLYLLYSENGDMSKAQDYLSKAQKIDPSIQ